MALTALHTLGLLVYDEVVIGYVMAQEAAQEVDNILLPSSGMAYNRLSGVGAVASRLTVETAAVKTALAKIGQTGAAISAMSTVDLYWLPYASGGLRDTTACRKISISSGIILPRQLSAPEAPGLASLSLEIIATSSDGETSPVTEATGQTLPTDPDAEAWLIADAAGITDWSLDFGLSELVRGNGGAIYPTFAAVERVQPSLTLNTLTLADLGDYTLTSVSLVDASQGAARGSNSITITPNNATKRAIRQAGQPGSLAVQVTPTHDGTNAPLTIAGLT
jgi:hypothetical protein